MNYECRKSQAGFTADSLKIGSRVVIGEYDHRKVSFDSHKVTWLKMSHDCRFISEYVLDNYYTAYYSGEDWIRENNERLLHILSGHDEPNGSISYKQSRTLTYGHEQAGFLRKFEPYEVDSILSVCLPCEEDITDSPLFHSKGRRAKASAEYIERLGESYKRGFVNYLIDSCDVTRQKEVGKTGSIQRASFLVGIRPVIKLKEKTGMMVNCEGIYQIKPYECFFDDEDVFKEFLKIN